MKANRKTIWNNDDRAQVGIGTMIVFIATILVAATAAAVLIDTSGKLQERSSSTGNEATKQVASNLVVKGVYGDRNSGTNIVRLNITLALAPGATAMDLNQTQIKYSTDDTVYELSHQATWGGANNNIFIVSELRDPKNTMTAAAPVLSPGGLANLQINLERITDDPTLAPRASVGILILPEVGAPIHADFTSPSSYGSDEIIVLR